MDQMAVQRAIGEELRAARISRGLLQQDIVTLLSGAVSVKTIGAYELGTRAMNVARLISLCDALEVRATLLLATAMAKARASTPRRISLSQVIEADTGH